MPTNRNALIRYKTIDQCLRNPYRKWTLEDLIDACSDALYEYEGIDKGISKRSVQADIQMMRSDKLGYNAPIVVKEKKYYTYEDPNYSITQKPLSNTDLEKLNEAVEILKQFNGFSHFEEMAGMVKRLEDKVYTAKSSKASIIHLEKNERLKGLNYIDELYKHIKNRQVLHITYQSFKAKVPGTICFSPYLLKEFKNRWFLIGKKTQQKGLMTLALDRIQKIEINFKQKFWEDRNFDPDSYFEHVIGVTVNEGMFPRKIQFLVNPRNAPYVLTKPIHHSQRLIEETPEGSILEINVVPNFELEKEILGFGEDIKVLGPPSFKERIQKRIELSNMMYSDNQQY